MAAGISEFGVYAKWTNSDAFEVTFALACFFRAVSGRQFGPAGVDAVVSCADQHASQANLTPNRF
jgi:hypothetical protein